MMQPPAPPKFEDFLVAPVIVPIIALWGIGIVGSFAGNQDAFISILIGIFAYPAACYLFFVGRYQYKLRTWRKAEVDDFLTELEKLP
jgi:hypothetical protein